MRRRRSALARRRLPVPPPRVRPPDTSHGGDPVKAALVEGRRLVTFLEDLRVCPLCDRESWHRDACPVLAFKCWVAAAERSLADALD